MKKNKLYVIIGIVALILVGLILYFALRVTDEGGFIRIRLYDANGNLIPFSLTNQPLSVVNGISGVSFIDLTVQALNTGAIPLSCDVLSSTPTAFDSALNRGAKTLSVGGKAEWTSNLISVASLESGTPVPFGATIRCQYTDASGSHYIDQTGSISITIQAEGTGGFTVGINQGGLPSEYCGDSICQSYESVTTCPNDCASVINVTFRASDLSYVLGSAVAYSSTCGSTLTQYGYSDTSCWTQTDATCPTVSGYTLRLNQAKNIKGRPSWAGSNVGCLYTYNTDSTLAIMAFKVVTTTTSPCGTAGQWGLIRYSSTDPDKTKVSSSPQSFTVSKEVTCP